MSKFVLRFPDVKPDSSSDAVSLTVPLAKPMLKRKDTCTGTKTFYYRTSKIRSYRLPEGDTSPRQTAVRGGWNQLALDLRDTYF